MSNYSVFRKGLFIASVFATGLFFCGCTKDDQMAASDADAPILTRASTFHWQCPNENENGETCGFRNGGWRNTCADCGKDYSPEHGNFLLTISDAIEVTSPREDGGGAYPSDPNPDLIQLPGNRFPAYTPPIWYETANALKYYENGKTVTYQYSKAYAEGYDFAWYRTVRMLFPRKTEKSKLQLKFDKFCVNEGRNLRDDKGRGIKAGTQAAIDAFLAHNPNP